MKKVRRKPEKAPPIPTKYYFCPDCKERRDKLVTPKVKREDGVYVCELCLTHVYPKEDSYRISYIVVAVGFVLTALAVYSLI